VEKEREKEKKRSLMFRKYFHNYLPITVKYCTWHFIGIFKSDLLSKCLFSADKTGMMPIWLQDKT
jgi:hypothetical protein